MTAETYVMIVETSALVVVTAYAACIRWQLSRSMDRTDEALELARKANGILSGHVCPHVFCSDCGRKALDGHKF